MSKHRGLTVSEEIFFTYALMLGVLGPHVQEYLTRQYVLGWMRTHA